MCFTRFQEMFGRYYGPLGAMDVMKEFALAADYIHRIDSDDELDDADALVGFDPPIICHYIRNVPEIDPVSAFDI